MSSTPSNGGEAPQVDPRFAEVLNAPLPDPASMSSTDRIARINLYKEMLKVMDIPEAHLRFGVTLITVDRAAASKEARSASASARKSSSAPQKPITLDDL